MLTLTKKLRRNNEVVAAEANNNNNNNNVVSNSKKISVRDRLLVKELQDVEKLLPPTCKLTFQDPDKLHEFVLAIRPDEGYWVGGVFLFSISIGEEYNFAPPTVKCTTRLWHPNINEEGAVCLSLLRQSSIDELGWAPTRTIKDVIWGLNSLFTDLLNFEDPLNIDASEMYQKDISRFQSRVKEYIKKYCKL